MCLACTYVQYDPFYSPCWLQIMSDTAKNPKVLDVCHSPNRLLDMEMLSSGLEKCQKSLNDYLDSKRNAFPRFFFISDDELLSILGSHECTCVQEHMIKVRCRARDEHCQHYSTSTTTYSKHTCTCYQEEFAL